MKREGEGNSTRQAITFRGIAFCYELHELSTKVVAGGGKRRGSSDRRDLGYKLIRVITVVSHLLGIVAGLGAREAARSGPPARDTEGWLKVCRGCETPSEFTTFPGIALRRHTTDVSPFEHAPALTRESAFN